MLRVFCICVLTFAALCMPWIDMKQARSGMSEEKKKKQREQQEERRRSAMQHFPDIPLKPSADDEKLNIPPHQDPAFQDLVTAGNNDGIDVYEHERLRKWETSHKAEDDRTDLSRPHLRMTPERDRTWDNTMHDVAERNKRISHEIPFIGRIKMQQNLRDSHASSSRSARRPEMVPLPSSGRGSERSSSSEAPTNPLRDPSLSSNSSILPEMITIRDSRQESFQLDMTPLQGAPSFTPPAPTPLRESQNNSAVGLDTIPLRDSRFSSSIVPTIRDSRSSAAGSFHPFSNASSPSSRPVSDAPEAIVARHEAQNSQSSSNTTQSNPFDDSKRTQSVTLDQSQAPSLNSAGPRAQSIAVEKPGTSQLPTTHTRSHSVPLDKPMPEAPKDVPQNLVLPPIPNVAGPNRTSMLDAIINVHKRHSIFVDSAGVPAVASPKSPKRRSIRIPKFSTGPKIRTPMGPRRFSGRESLQSPMVDKPLPSTPEVSKE